MNLQSGSRCHPLFMIAFQGTTAHRDLCAPRRTAPDIARPGGPSFVALAVLERSVCRDIFAAMGFRVISDTSVQEFVESATAALDRVRLLIKARLPNVRVLTEDGRVLSLSELEGLAEFENESDDAQKSTAVIAPVAVE
jgi:hypothetical protein